MLLQVSRVLHRGREFTLPPQVSCWLLPVLILLSKAAKQSLPSLLC